MVKLASLQPGFLGVESAREGVGITVSYWDSLEAIQKWSKTRDTSLRSVKEWQNGIAPIKRECARSSAITGLKQ